MPKILLSANVSLEGVQEVALRPDFPWCFSVLVNGEDEPKPRVAFSALEQVPVPNSKSQAHLVLKLPDGKGHATLDLISIKNVTRNIGANDDEKFVPVAALECRGCTVTAWHLGDGGFDVTSESGARYQDVSLAEDWIEYDQELKGTVSVSNFKYKLEPYR